MITAYWNKTLSKTITFSEVVEYIAILKKELEKYDEDEEMYIDLENDLEEAYIRKIAIIIEDMKKDNVIKFDSEINRVEIEEYIYDIKLTIESISNDEHEEKEELKKDLEKAYKLLKRFEK